MTVKLGVTGTRDGMTPYQRETITRILTNCPSVGELHHGDCVGVDVEVAILARSMGWRIVCHPPVDEKLRAFAQYDEIRTAKTHFARNRNIVMETQCLLVVPKQMEHQAFGGTWYTHDYAKKTGKTVILAWPEEKNEIVQSISS